MRDARGDVQYGIFADPPRADRPDLDLVRLDLDPSSRRVVRWTVKTAEPLEGLRRRLRLTMDLGRREFEVRNRKLERIEFPEDYDRPARVTYRRARFVRLGPRRFRWVVKRRHLFRLKRLAFQARAEDRSDLKKVAEADGHDIYGAAMDFAPDRLSDPVRVTP